MRRALADVEDAGVVDLDPKGKHGARVKLAPDWRARLDERREEGGEFARARRQALKHRNDRLGYLDRGSVDEVPTEVEMPGAERMAAILEAHREEWRRQDEAERPETPASAQAETESLVEKILVNLGTVRYGLLREIWQQDRDGREIDLKRALREGGYPLRPHAEHPGELRVYPVDTSAPVPTPKTPPAEPNPYGARSAPEQVHSPRSPGPMPKVSPDGLHRHGPSCLCEWCDEAPITRYVKLGG